MANVIVIAETFPDLPCEVQFERSNLLCDIEERSAKVARMEIEVVCQRDALIEALGLLVRTAETVRYGLEMGRLSQMESDELSAPLQLLFRSRDLHESSLETIAYEKAQIEDLQRTLNDSEYWTEESTRQIEARRAAKHV